MITALGQQIINALIEFNPEKIILFSSYARGSLMALQAGEKALKSCLYATGKRRLIGHSFFKKTHC